MNRKYFPTARLRRLSNDALIANLIRCYLLLCLRKAIPEKITLKRVRRGGRLVELTADY